MVFSASTFCRAVLLLLPIISGASAYNSDKNDIVAPKEWKTIHIENKDIKNLPSAGYGNDDTERLVYWVDGKYAIKDDINLGLEADLKKHQKGSYRNNKRGHSIFPTDVDQRWPDATITYKYADAAAEAGLKTLVDQALGHWKDASPFLNFKMLPTSGKHEPGTLLIQMTSGAGACWGEFFNSFSGYTYNV